MTLKLMLLSAIILPYSFSSHAAQEPSATDSTNAPAHLAKLSLGSPTSIAARGLSPHPANLPTDPELATSPKLLLGAAATSASSPVTPSPVAAKKPSASDPNLFRVSAAALTPKSAAARPTSPASTPKPPTARLMVTIRRPCAPQDLKLMPKGDGSVHIIQEVRLPNSPSLIYNAFYAHSMVEAELVLAATRNLLAQHQ